MFKRFKHLRKNIDLFQGKIEFVTYMSAVVLLCFHILFLAFYVYEKVYLMTIIDILGILIYSYYVQRGIKSPDIFGFVCYFCVLIHAVLAILCLGWAPGYYLWLYGLVCAFFLPTFGKFDGKAANRPLIFGMFYVFIYFLLGFLMPSGMLKPLYSINEITIIVLYGINSVIVFFTIISFSYFFTTRQKVKEDSLKHMADYDALTNLRNRNAINRIIDERVKTNKEVFSLAIIDIDFFKNVNDTYGHNAGDLVLKEIATKIKKLEGFGIISARWGGEEFIMLSPCDMDNKQFIDIMQDFRRSIRESKFNYNKSIIKVTVSIGISIHKKNHAIKKAIDKADKHLYKAKETGRNKVIY